MRKEIPRTNRKWHGMQVFLYCQRCGKKLPRKPATVNFQVLTRLCRDCYTMQMGVDATEYRMSGLRSANSV